MTDASHQSSSKKKFYFFGTLGLVIILVLLIRSYIVHNAFEKTSKGLERKYHIKLSAESISASALRSVSLENVTITPLDAPEDTLLFIETLDASVRLLPLMNGDLRLKTLEAKRLSLKLQEYNDSLSNFGAILEAFQHSQTLDTLRKIKSENLGWNIRSKNLLRLLYSQIPDAIRIDNLSVFYSSITDSVSLALEIPQFVMQDNFFRASVSLSERNILPYSVQEETQRFIVSGLLNRKRESAEVNLYGAPFISLPYFKNKFGLVAKAKDLTFKVDPAETEDSYLKVGSLFSVNQIQLYHPKISTDTLSLEKGSLNAIFRIDSKAIVVEPETQLSFSTEGVDSMNVLLSLWFDRSDSLQVGLQLKTDTLSATRFFESLPLAMRKDLGEMRFKGKLAYSLYLNIDWRKLDEVILESSVYTDSFKVLDYGNIDFQKLTGKFSHEAKEKDSRTARVIELNPSNQSFTPLVQIPKHLIGAVLTNEDGGFFLHRGFNEASFATAIADNIRRSEFVRGGSTISMQLVKNIYLNRKKTLARKFEEIWIVWLLERSGFVSKERLLEIYLNIIEWGPNVYGIAEASQFYFSKRPSQLTLEESLFLGSIIPSPKRFFWAFKEGKLREERVEQMSFVLQKMKERQYTKDSTLSGNLRLTGKAASMLKFSMPLSDTLQMNDE
ncbi:MAG: transglycosylase domain-containing protein [Chloroherpetonaceae bacterium]|nr:transglycosylase domain-containing protein [Chloroherpetonaceae bacterium]